MGPRNTGIRRREVLGVAGGAALAGVAGCTALVDWIGDKVLGDVNIFNNTTGRITGTIVVTREDGTTVLDESFDAPPTEDDDGNNSEADEGDASTDSSDDTEVFEDVWDGSGTYEVRVRLDDDQSVQNEDAATASISIDDPDEEMLAVVLGADDVDAGVGFATGDALSEFQDGLVDRSNNETDSDR